MIWLDFKYSSATISSHIYSIFYHDLCLFAISKHLETFPKSPSQIRTAVVIFTELSSYLIHHRFKSLGQPLLTQWFTLFSSTRLRSLFIFSEMRDLQSVHACQATFCFRMVFIIRASGGIPISSVPALRFCSVVQSLTIQMWEALVMSEYFIDPFREIVKVLTVK